jgi:hypothetical protein
MGLGCGLGDPNKSNVKKVMHACKEISERGSSMPPDVYSPVFRPALRALFKLYLASSNGSGLSVDSR